MSVYKATLIHTTKEKYYRAEYQANGTWYWVTNAWNETCQFANEEDALSAAAREIGINHPPKAAQDFYDYSDRT